MKAQKKLAKAEKKLAKRLAKAESTVQFAAAEVLSEFKAATKNHGAFHSCHEGYGVILEEVEELWEEVMKKRSNRSKEKLYQEAKQVAAMGLRFMVDLEHMQR